MTRITRRHAHTFSSCDNGKANRKAHTDLTTLRRIHFRCFSLIKKYKNMIFVLLFPFPPRPPSSRAPPPARARGMQQKQLLSIWPLDSRRLLQLFCKISQANPVKHSIASTAAAWLVCNHSCILRRYAKVWYCASIHRIAHMHSDTCSVTGWHLSATHAPHAQPQQH